MKYAIFGGAGAMGESAGGRAGERRIAVRVAGGPTSVCSATQWMKRTHEIRIRARAGCAWSKRTWRWRPMERTECGRRFCVRGDFYGPDSELSCARAIFVAALKGSRADVIGPVERPHEFIFVPGGAKALLALAEKPCIRRRWDAKLRAVNKTMLRLPGLSNPFLREVVEMHYLRTTPVLLDDSRLRGAAGAQ